MQKHLLFLAILLFFKGLSAQNIQIDYSSPASFFVCDTASFSVTLTNNGPVPAGPLTTTLNFPNGVTYVQGSVSGATYGGIAGGAPFFVNAVLAPGASVTFSLKARASCDLVQDINAGQQFTNTIMTEWPSGNNQVTTEPYPVETPLLLIVSSTNANTFAQLGQQVIRSFTIRNTRLGALDNFVFEDDYPDGGFSVSTDVGTVLQNIPGLLSILLGPADFQQIGDGDGLFELNEEITITETLLVTDCGIDVNQSISTLRAEWSCSGEVCQFNTSTATLNLLPATGKPKLEFEGVVNVQEDLCGQLPTRQHARITNTGDQPAIGAWFCLFMLEGDGGPDIPWAGIDSTTIGLDSAGIWTAVHPYSALPISLFDCPDQGPFFTNVCFKIPWLAPGASVVVGFDLYACSTECPSDFPGWQIDFWLPKNCPPGQVEHGYGIGPAPYVIDVLNDPEWQICVKEPLHDDQEYSMLYSLSSLLLSDSQGVVRINFRLPCGMSMGSQPFTLNGVSPVAVGAYPDADTTVQWFEFPIPFPQSYAIGQFSIRWDCDQVCPDLEAECLHFFDAPGSCEHPCDADPDSLPRTRLNIVSEFLLHPQVAPGCGIKQCVDYNFVYDCSGDSCLTPIDGWVEHQSSIRRTSFGLPDNDGDRMPDPGGALDFSKIKLNRFMPGDTAETLLQGVVHGSQPGLSFENGLLRMYFDAYESDVEIDTGTFSTPCGNGNLVVPLLAQLHLRDAETGQAYDCILGAPELKCVDQQIVTININSLLCADTIENISGMSWTWDISPAALAAAGCAVPANLVFTEGDSINLRVISYFAHPLPTELHLNMRAGTFVNVFNGYQPVTGNYEAPPQDFSCSCPYTLIQYTSLHAYLNRSKFYLPPCEPSVSPMQQDFEVRMSFGDFFPYEYRPVVRARQLDDFVTASISLANTFLDSLQLQDGPVILQDAPLGSSVSNSLFSTPLTTLPEPDEGFTLHFNQTWTAPCNLNVPQGLAVGLLFDWLPPLPFAGEGVVDTFFTIDPVKDDTFGFIPIRPTLSAFSALPNLTGTGNMASWDITLVQNGAPVEAPWAWFFPQSLSGLLTDFQLFEMPSQTPVPEVNGIFQVGDIPVGAARQYRLKARNNSCDQEVLILYYGWNCDTLTVPNEFACQRKNIVLKVQAQPAELEINVTTPGNSAALCDTSDYHVAEVFNALYGAAYAPRLSVQLPPGLALLPGSCQMAFPSGSAWVNVPDPQIQPGGWLGWELANLNTNLAQQGLAGFPFAPLHSASLRFRTLSSCGFISGNKILYRTWAEQTCGDTTNLLVKPGSAILLDGVAPPYNASLGLVIAAPPPHPCGEPLPVQLLFNADGPTGQNDSLYVQLPPGAAYITGSYQPGPNAPTSPPFVQMIDDQQVLTWNLLPGTPAGSSASLNFAVQTAGLNVCKADTLRAWSTQWQTAVCVADGSVCGFSSSTGETTFTFDIDHPTFSLTAFSVHLENNVPMYALTLTNTGALDVDQPFLLHFFRDKDGNGALSAADTLLTTATNPTSLPAGQTVTLPGPLSLDLADLCKLIVVLDVQTLCLCDTLSRALDSLAIDLMPLSVCSGEEVTLGSATLPGHQYAWSPSDGLSCADCADPLFQGVYNPGNQSIVLNYQLTESSGACVASGTQSVTLFPMLVLFNPDTAICAGQSVLLQASPVWSYFWTGPGILDPTAATQLVTPSETGVYSVDLIDVNNCMATDIVVITVWPLPDFAFAQDTLGVCGSQQLMLDGPDGPGLLYDWSPANAVSDPELADPLFVGQQSTTLVLTVRTETGQCPASDSLFVGFSDNPVIDLSATSLANCVGDTALVSVSGAEYYVWTPQTGVNCTAGDCAEVLLTPGVTTQYTVIGFNNFGCRDTAQLTVTVPGAVQHTAETLVTCAGEPVPVFDLVTDAAGEYCRSFTSINGCDSVHCITLITNDTLYAELLRTLCPGGVVTEGGIAYTQPGRYCQTYLTAEGCDSTLCIVIDAAPVPALDTFVRIVIGPGQTPVLTLPGGFAAYHWSPADNLSCSDCAAPVFTPPVPAPDSVSYAVTVTNAAGCTSVVSYRVRMLPPCDPDNVRMPNAFSPDGDGVNEVFRPVAQEGLEVILGLEIYNRWGQKVYAGSGPDAGWDGRIGGKDAAVDAYIYILEVACDGEKGKRTGEVNLLR